MDSFSEFLLISLAAVVVCLAMVGFFAFLHFLNGGSIGYPLVIDGEKVFLCDSIKSNPEGVILCEGSSDNGRDFYFQKKREPFNNRFEDVDKKLEYKDLEWR